MTTEAATTPTGSLAGADAGIDSGIDVAADGRRLSDATLRRIGSTLSLAAIVTAPIALVVTALVGELGRGIENFAIINIETMFVYGVLGLVLVRAEPRNRLVWFFVLVAVANTSVATIAAGGELLARDQGVPFEQLDTSGWPPGLAAVAGALYACWVVGNFGLPTFGLLLAPDGHLPSRRWRPIAALVAASLVVFWVVFARNWPIRGGSPELVVDETARGLVMVNYLLLFVLIPVSYWSFVRRYRRSGGEARRRLRWILIGGGILVAAFFTEVFLSSILNADYFLIVFYPLLAFAFAMAIWRDQLFDIDVVVNRTLVYGSILLAIGLIYVAVVFGADALIGERVADSAVLPLVATATVALLAQPLRSRAEQVANRIVFGRRASPYEVLSDFTQRMAATDEQLLADVARSIVDGTTVTAAGVWRVEDGLLTAISAWPDDQTSITSTPLPAAGDDLALPGAERTYPIQHDGHLIGALGLQLPAGEDLPPADEALVTELSGGIGLALGNRELTGELQARVEELRSSRRRLVAVQDATRHRLERDLHDGAQQRLVAAKVRLSIAQQMAAKAGATEVAADLAQLCAQADEVIESLRETARGIYSPVLATVGLAVALATPIDRSPLRIELTGELSHRHDRDVEATAYFSILETLAAIERIGTDQPVRVTVADDEASGLTFEVAASVPVEPLIAVEDRVEALGGTVRFGPNPTVVQARIPSATSDGWRPTSDGTAVVPV
ncbi:MAG: histidine kinase [Actinomycetota bacterium]